MKVLIDEIELKVLKYKVEYLEHIVEQQELQLQDLELFYQASCNNKHGCKSILEDFPDNFTREYALEQGANANDIKRWKHRKYIVETSTYNYTKTNYYKQKCRKQSPIHSTE